MPDLPVAAFRELREQVPESPKEWMLAVVLLWEFVGFARIDRVTDLSTATNSHAFITLLTVFVAAPCWHAVCTNAG
jgi:hypothetical protein